MKITEKRTKNEGKKDPKGAERNKRKEALQ